MSEYDALLRRIEALEAQVARLTRDTVGTGEERYECVFCERVEYGSAEGIPGWGTVRVTKSPPHIWETACPGCKAARRAS